MSIENIRLIMKSKKMRAFDLAEASGVPIDTLTKILAGTTMDPRLSTIKAIAEALECSIDEFSDKEPEIKDELEEYLEMLHKRPEMKTLFSLSKDATKEDVEKTIKIIEMFRSNKE